MSKRLKVRAPAPQYTSPNPRRKPERWHLLGAELKNRRTNLSKTYKDVAREAGVAWPAVRKVEMGLAVDMFNFNRLCKWLGQSQSWWLDRILEGAD